ncbi:MAG: hypothetical protein COW01_02475 [Bdellovibrionales bacterium CG12_big_fil_rev_8_21_14_0_65_38_15]|nr:MAG: hypothetical protein COW79_08140 [Bdellovibrionales bacterium CG22_combo_CG10-13_8_21_14_all_38_13]PIQ56958.1 MAG: hypothetical protein COW01_02475 [Bdellovibrionales bacterium CG12_big_fil_rev_8_21_14_0_65_38_15]PIR29081.1 MAG: hypothetical protein COV38_12645 [Bdellovibrionales bacterium CG11_big_fil_rev_8_21_14_0_20_38_13]
MSFQNLPIEIKDLIPGYLENREKEIETLYGFVSDRNLSEINKIGHKLAGNAGSYGLEELGKVGEKLEFATDLSDISQLLSEYKKLLQRYKELL